ncbi:hypothetical protein BX666DRAFT_1967021 [Dichotomocladium elegans]|nr:hypothetical protein BX666DRAFT_1967021 [Dichotomocladium elegans]
MPEQKDGSGEKTNPLMTDYKDIPPVIRDAAGNEIELRPYYGEKDRNYVHFLVYSTYFDLVPQGVRHLLRSPVVLGLWLAIVSFLYMWIPAHLSWQAKFLTWVRIAIVFAGLCGGVFALFMLADQKAHRKIQESLQTDLKDPGAYYRTDNGNFWVLTVQGQPVACIGLDHHLEPVYKHQAPQELTHRLAEDEAIRMAHWKQVAYVLARIDDAIRSFVIRYLTKKKGDASAKEVLFDAHKPNEAHIRHLAVKTNLQSKGLSTPLLKRVAFWAHAHQIDYLFAETNELQTKASAILSKRHGYQLVSKKKNGLFGEISLWRLDVKLWMSKEIEKRELQRQERERIAEEEELKEYM